MGKGEDSEPSNEEFFATDKQMRNCVLAFFCGVIFTAGFWLLWWLS